MERFVDPDLEGLIRSYLTEHEQARAGLYTTLHSSVDDYLTVRELALEHWHDWTRKDWERLLRQRYPEFYEQYQEDPFLLMDYMMDVIQPPDFVAMLTLMGSYDNEEPLYERMFDDFNFILYTRLRGEPPQYVFDMYKEHLVRNHLYAALQDLFERGASPSTHFILKKLIGNPYVKNRNTFDSLLRYLLDRYSLLNTRFEGPFGMRSVFRDLLDISLDTALHYASDPRLVLEVEPRKRGYANTYISTILRKLAGTSPDDSTKLDRLYQILDLLNQRDPTYKFKSSPGPAESISEYETIAPGSIDILERARAILDL